METGELAESVRNRSILRQLHIETTGIPGTCGGSIPETLAAAGLMSESTEAEEERMEFAAGIPPVVSTAGPLPGYSEMPWRQVTAAANSLAAMGAIPAGFSLQGILPVSYEESQLREDMKQFDAEARGEGAAFCHADIQVSGAISVPQYFVTGIGWHCVETTLPGPESPTTSRKMIWNRTAARERPGLLPGQELVLTRRIALAGTAALARAQEKVLRQRFPFRLVDRALGFGQWMSVTEAARAVNHFGPCPMLPLAQGGIFNALWEMAEQTGVGLEVDLKKIPLYQETVEICEFFDVNPYYLYSAGALLIGTDRAEDLIAMLREKDIPACVIGRVTDKKERVILNGENRRYLDRPKRDEWWRLAAAN